MAEVKIRVKTEDQGSAALQQTGRRIDGLNDNARRAGAGLGKLAVGVGVVGAGLATMGAAAAGAMRAISEGAALELAASRFDNLAASIGTTAEALKSDMGAATQGMMSQAAMVDAASGIISLGLADTGDEVVRLSNLVGQLGWDMNVLTLTMANNSMMRLDALGLSMQDVTARMEALKAAGMGADEAFDLAVIEAGEAKLQLLGSSADSTTGKIQQMTAMWEDAVNAFKMEFADSVSGQLAAVAGSLESSGPAFEAGMSALGERAGRVVGSVMATAAADGLYLERKKLEDQLLEIGVPRQALRQMWQDALAETGLSGGDVAGNGRAMLEYETAVNEILQERYGIALQLSNATAWQDWATGQRQAVDAARMQQQATEDAAAAIRDAGNAAAFSTDQYWEMGRSQGAMYGSFEYGQMVIEQQAAAVDNLAARTEAYQVKLERLWEMQAAGGDFFMQQAGSDTPIFSADMVANADALNQMIIGIADNAGVGAPKLADLNIQLGEMEPNAARALVAATVAQQAIEILIGAWQGGQIDTGELLANIDAVILELQNKELPAIELDITAKMNLAEGGDFAPGERRWMEMMGETPEIPIEATLEPFEAALATALGQITGAPTEARTLQLLAEYEGVTEVLETEIPAAVKGMSAESRTIEFIPDDKAVQGVIAALDNSHISIIVDYVNNNPPPAPRAAGGPVAGDVPYWVGEAGPELFVPWTSGNIVPNHRVGGAGGGIEINLNFYGPTNSADVRQAADSAGRQLLERVRRAGVVV